MTQLGQWPWSYDDPSGYPKHHSAVLTSFRILAGKISLDGQIRHIVGFEHEADRGKGQPSMTATIASVVISFAVLLAVFRTLELLRPRDTRLPILRAGFWTDLTYWVFTAFATKAFTRLCVTFVLVPVALIVYGKLDRDLISNGFGPASQLPLWLQAVLIIALADLVSYWMHRLFHGPWLWKFHAVHHSSQVLDWLAAVRVHPINDALMRVMSTLPIIALGFAPKAVVGVTPILTLMAILIHANLDWDWGPLRSVIASPRFHRWHHTSESEGRDKNFAGFLPLWDILFGTYYMPKERAPTKFGTHTPVPSGLIGQLAYPFRRD